MGGAGLLITLSEGAVLRRTATLGSVPRSITVDVAVVTQQSGRERSVLSDAHYIRGTNHARKLTAAMNDFHRALTRRWRELVCQAVIEDRQDFPTTIRRPIGRHNYQPLAWDAWSVPARHHLNSSAGCAYVNWVKGGQVGSLSAVSCSGQTDAHRETQLPDLQRGDMVTVPPNIYCGMGDLLRQVEDWAWGEREELYYKLPLFDRHSLAALEIAHDTLIQIGAELALVPAEGSAPHVAEGFPSLESRDIQRYVSGISPEDGEGQDWWAGWTGLAASRAGSGFFASVVPTLRNQSLITGALANLYSYRATIIEKGRNDGLFWIQRATAKLDETELYGTDLVPYWKAMQGVGMAIALRGAWVPKVGAIGGLVTLIGFIAENLLPGTEVEGPSHDIQDVVEWLHDRIRTLNDQIDVAEQEYQDLVFQFREKLYRAHSYNLELYDLTQNNPDGDRGDRSPGSFHVEIYRILRIAEYCYRAGDSYANLLPMIDRTTIADAHLADADGRPTPADTILLELRDQLQGFLRTTCGRYLIAGEQVHHAAELYAETDLNNRKAFEDVMGEWEKRGVGDYDLPFDPEEYAQPTDRSEANPDPDGAEPGVEDGDHYVVEGETRG